jgi:hypothetical protein
MALTFSWRWVWCGRPPTGSARNGWCCSYPEQLLTLEYPDSPRVRACPLIPSSTESPGAWCDRLARTALSVELYRVSSAAPTHAFATALGIRVSALTEPEFVARLGALDDYAGEGAGELFLMWRMFANSCR